MRQGRPKKENDMINKKERKTEIAHHIFSGSVAMIGVCITIISLFKVMHMDAQTLADNILGINTFIFIISAIISYMSLRKDSNKILETIADVMFFIGMFIMVLVGAIIVFSAW